MSSKGRGGSPSESEDNVEKALVSLKKEGLILDFLRTNRNKQFDKKGIDFVIFLNGNYSGLSIPLQVKSRPSEEKDHFNKHPNIKALVVSKSNDSLSQSKKKILKLINKIKTQGKNESSKKFVIK